MRRRNRQIEIRVNMVERMKIVSDMYTNARALDSCESKWGGGLGNIDAFPRRHGSRGFA